MRAQTKQRLLAVLEGDLAKVKEKLKPKHQKPMQDLASEMGEIAIKLQSKNYGPTWDRLNTRYKKLDVDFQKLLKVATRFNNNIEKNMQEQWALEDEITELKRRLGI